MFNCLGNLFVDFNVIVVGGYYGYSVIVFLDLVCVVFRDIMMIMNSLGVMIMIYFIWID